MHERPNESGSRWAVDSGEQQAKRGDGNLLDIAELACGAKDSQEVRRKEDAPNKTTGRTDAAAYQPEKQSESRT
jgi:hypothetical protein